MGGRKRTWEAISFEVVMTAIALIALIVIIAPSLVVLIVSFTNGFSLKFPPPGYSARWYAELWNAWQLHFAAKNSFVVAMWSTGLSIVLGVAAALAIARSATLSARVLELAVHVATGASRPRLRAIRLDAVLAGRHAGVRTDPGHRPYRGLRPLCGSQHGGGACPA